MRALCRARSCCLPCCRCWRHWPFVAAPLRLLKRFLVVPHQNHSPPSRVLDFALRRLDRPPEALCTQSQAFELYFAKIARHPYCIFLSSNRTCKLRSKICVNGKG